MGDNTDVQYAQLIVWIVLHSIIIIVGVIVCICTNCRKGVYLISVSFKSVDFN